ncbi:alanine racemase [bacterium]|nr:alanine racemase [bacterium]
MDNHSFSNIIYEIVKAKALSLEKSLNHPLVSTNGVVRPTRVEVNLDTIKGNYFAVKRYVGKASVMAILKANAYGHGLVRIAQLMESIGSDYLGVAVLEEGLLLREKGIHIPILVLGGILGNQVPHFIKNDLTITASSIDKLLIIESVAGKLGTKAKVHLKIDTGMERIGVHYYNAENFIKAAYECGNIEVEGIFSHFANSDSADLSHAELQISRFREVLDLFKKNGLQKPRFVHMANSGAILQIPDSLFNMVRPGIVLYGVYPSADVKKTVRVEPALSWKSRVVYFKVVLPGHPVGYGSTWKAEKPVRAVTVPAGYGDGYMRSMSGKAKVIIRGRQYPVIGTISMDQIVVNIGNDSAFNDDEVILIGNSGSSVIRSEDLAEWANTIPYEILTNINTRVPRVYLGGDD